MDNNGILENVRTSTTDKEKMYFIYGITHDRTRLEAILLLKDDNNKLKLVETIKDNYIRTELYSYIIQNEEMIDKVIGMVISSNNLTLKQKIRIFNKIPNTKIETKMQVIGGCILEEECSGDERNLICQAIKEIYKFLKERSKKFSIIEFMNMIKNDCVVVNIMPFFEMNELERRKIILNIKDKKVQEQAKLIYGIEKSKTNKKNSKKQKLNLPENMTIGVELEAKGKMFSAFIDNKINETWEAKEEYTLSHGVEVASPKLNNTPKDIQQIYDVCNIMKACDLYIDTECGGHIHIGADYLDTKESIQALIVLWLANEEVIYRICNKKGEIPREGIKTFAKPLSKKYAECSDDIFKKLKLAKTREELICVLKEIQKKRTLLWS